VNSILSAVGLKLMEIATKTKTKIQEF